MSSNHTFLFKWGRILSRGRMYVPAGGRDGCEPWLCVREAAVPTVHETHTWGRSIATWRAEHFCFPPLPRPQGLYLAPNSAARLWSWCRASPGKQPVLPAPAPPPPALESSPQVGRAGPACNRPPVPLRGFTRQLERPGCEPAGIVNKRTCEYLTSDLSRGAAPSSQRKCSQRPGGTAPRSSELWVRKASCRKTKGHIPTGQVPRGLCSLCS